MIGALALTSGCAFHNPFAKKAEPVTYEAVVQSELSPEEKVDKLVANMSDADKVGQLLMIGIHGTTLNDDAKFMLNEYRVGGIILFDRNMESKEQVKTLITDINKAGKSAGLTPLFIGIDQEGGAVARMEDKLIKVPPAEELGQGSVDHAANLAKQVGTELKDLGFNINFAPDADLGLTYGRSYSTNPDQVVKFAGAVGKAYDESGLWYSYKHFPGIGKTDVDLKNIEENKAEVNNYIQELTNHLNLRNGELSSIKNSGDLIDIDKIKICHENAVARWEILSNQLHQSKEEFDKESAEFNRKKDFCQGLKSQLNNTLCIDPSNLKDQIQEIDIKQQEIRNKITEINHMISINESPLTTIKRIYHDAIATEKKYNTTKTLYDFVSGKSSNSESGCISLENYVQRTYLQRVVGAANDRLAVMTDSQFVLKTKGDKKYKKKEYLDLEVTDLYTGKDRDVKSLSGGEKFMTSLALALGFSDVIQQDAGGIQLDSMFIDEGFGTLDSETLEQALRLLDQLSTNSNTLVGIISHVEELKNRIPQQIVVSKDLNGSSLEVVIK